MSGRPTSAELGLRAREGTHHIFRDLSLLVAGRDGSVRADRLQGFFYANTRLLSRFAFLIDGQPVDAVQVQPARNDLFVGYYQDTRVTHDPVLQDRALILQLTVAAGRGFHLDLDARNHSLDALACELLLELDADFADIEETRGGADVSKIMGANPDRAQRRLQFAPVRRACALERGELRFDYEHGGLSAAAALRFSDPPVCHDRGVAWPLRLAPQASWHTCLDVIPLRDGRDPGPRARCYGARTPADGAQSDDPDFAATAVRTSNDSVRLTYERAVEDLRALALREGTAAERPAFAAGIPIYHNAFGRDLLTTAWQAALATPVLLESALLVCERSQGRTTDDIRDEQPGRIVQQLRTGPLSALGLLPRGRYYSDYSAPGDFLIMVGQQFMWTGDRDALRDHLPAARRVLDWLDRDADLDGDGFYEYQTRSPVGDRHQGWKDSEHAIPHADGADAPLPVATCEVQAYVYVGKMQLGAALLALGRLREGWRLLREAAALKERFNRAFWQPEWGFLAMALDGAKRPVRSVGSNAGHCLATGIVDERHAPAVIERLMAPAMFSGWGVRTLSVDHPAYNPFGYHLGSVWTVEQGSIAFGMKRYGFGEHTNAIARGTYDLAERYQLHRLPEAVGGLPRDDRHPFPGLYPQACWPQAWSSGAAIQLLQAILGLRPVAPLGLLFVYPELPAWLPDVTLRGLRVGGSRLSIAFRREADGHTGYRVLERDGPVRVVRASPDKSARHSVVCKVLDPIVGALTEGV